MKKVEKIDVDKFYVSCLSVYKMTQEMYSEPEVGESSVYMLMQKAKSESDANKKIKVFFAKQIFDDDDNEIFGCSSMQITHEDIDRILEIKQP